MASAAAALPSSCIVAATHLGVRDLATFLRTKLALGAITEEVSFDLELAMVEAANNIVEHAYGGVEGTIQLIVIAETDAIVMMLEDHGRPVSEHLFALPLAAPLEETSGRGIGILWSCVSEIGYERAGEVNRLRLVKKLG